MSPSMRVGTFAGSLVLVAGLGLTASCGGDGGGSVTGENGKVDPGNGATKTAQAAPSVRQGLPEGFPTGEIPLVEEKIVNGATGPAGGPFAWSVVMTSGRQVSDLSTEIISRFSSADYTTVRTTDLADVTIQQFTNATYDVGVTIARTGDGVTITYLVKKQS